MKKIMSWLLIFSILFMPLENLSASEALDLFMKNKKIQVDYSKYFPNECTNCTDANKPIVCPAYYDYMVDEAVKGTFYGAVTGKKIADTCLPPNVPMPSSVSVVSNRLKEIYGAPRTLNVKNMEECFRENKVNSANTNAHKKILLSYMYGLDESLKERQRNKIKEIALSDQLLGNKILSDIHCSDHENHCNQLKKCPGQEQAFDQTADYTITSLKEILELEKQLAQTYQQLMFKDYNNVNVADVKKAQEDIKDKIKFVNQMNPWLGGDTLKKQVDNLKKLIANNEPTKAKEVFKTHFTKQIENARNLEKRELVELNMAQDCLVDNYSCDSKTLDKLNSYYLPKKTTPIRDSKLSLAELREINVSRDGGACIARLKLDKDKLEENSLLIGRIVGGFAIGGVGGVVRLGAMATRFYQTGSRLRGIASATALGVEGKMALETFKNVGDSCKKAINSLNTNEDAQMKMCSDEAKGIFKISNLKPCITNIALTTIPAVIAIKGIKNVKGLGGQPSKSKVNEVKAPVVLKSDDIAKKINSPILSAAEKNKMALQIDQMKLKDHELLDVIAKINNTVKTTADKHKVSDYMNYVSSLKPNEKMAALREIGTNTFKAGNIKGSYTRAFLSKEGKFNKYEKYNQILQERSLIKKGVSAKDAKAQSAIIARESREKMHKKIYACQSKTVTPEHKAAAARFVGLSTAIGVAGTGFGNYRANSDVYEKDKVDWFAKLGYDIVMSVIISRITGKIMTTAGDGPVKRYFKSNAAYASVGSLDGIVYSNIYGVSKADAQKKLEQIKNSPELSKELKILEKYIDQNNIAKKFEDQIVNDYKKVLSSKEKTKIMGHPPYKIGYETFNSLTAKDLDNPAIRDKLVQGIIIEMNKGVENPIISTGDLGADRWVNDRVWSAAIGVPKGIVVSAVMFQILCVGSDKPFTSLGLATGVQITNQFLNGDAYYKFRRAMIGQ